jgi:predicted acyl esterase
VHRALPAVLTATVLSVTGLLAAPGASAADPTITSTELQFEVTVGPDDDTTCLVDADIHVPSTATAAAPAPAVLTTNGFGGSKDDQDGAGQALGREGYVTLSYTGLGFPDSGCKITLDDPDYDGKAAKQLVDFLGGTKADTAGHTVDFYAAVAQDAPGDPKVGMIGGSYGGQVQFAAAGLDHRIDALIPIITWNDLSYSLAPNNTSFTRGVTYGTPGVHKRQWSSLFFGVGITDGIQGSAIDPSRNVGCPNFTDQACLSKAQLDARGWPDQATLDLSRHASVSSYMQDVVAPTLLVQGQKDTLFNLQEAAATYRGMQAQGTEVKMIWQSWGHSLGGEPAPGELDLNGTSDLGSSYLGGRFLDWFNRYVKDDAAVTTGPEFTYFRDWVGYSGIATPAYGTSTAYPVGSPLALYLSSDTLVTKKSAVRPGSQSYANAPGGVGTSYSETSSQGGNATDPLPPSDSPGTFAKWTSEPLSDATVTVGMPKLTVKLDSPVAAASQAAGPDGQLVVFAKLYDVAPDGTKTLHNRLISPVRIADVTNKVEIELPGVVQRWAKGHRIQLVLAASDTAYNGNTAVLPVTIAANPADPGVLTLPVLSGPGPANTKPPKTTTPAAGSGSGGGSGSGSGSGSAGSGSDDGVLGGTVGDGTVVQGSRFSPAASMASTGTDIASYARIAALGLGLAVAGAGLLRWSRRQRTA